MAAARVSALPPRPACLGLPRLTPDSARSGRPRHPIARLGAARLHTPRVTLLGTLRRDASPRISPVEPCIVAGQLLIGAMAWPTKVDDPRQDPRYTLHSAVTAPDGGEGELKLSGRAVETGHDHHRGPAEAW